MDIAKILSDVPRKIYRNSIWYKAGPIVKRHFGKSTVSQFINVYKADEDYRDFGTGIYQMIYLSEKGIIKAVLRTSPNSLSPQMRDYKSKCLESLLNNFRASSTYAMQYNELVDPSSTISVKSQFFDSDRVKIAIQNFFRKNRNYTRYFSAAELYPKMRILQSPGGKNNLEYAKSILDTLVKEGFLEIASKSSTRVRTYRITDMYLKLDLNES